MFVNRSLIPYHHFPPHYPHHMNHHQHDISYPNDISYPTNNLLNNNLALLNDDILSRISRKGGRRDELYLPGSEQQHQVNWNDPNKFEAILNVTNFTPEEITIKVAGNSLSVEGKHEERQVKHGYVSRQFTRRYILPDDVHLEQLSSSMDRKRKTLTIHAPKKRFQFDGSERVIPITVGEKKQLEGARDVVMKG